ncbi:sensor domain-containing protein [Exiguobacterium flavidum]|uniref:sensor domain-containing protein n=1 Tax=Exiguobacterium flavidum TaxID=2184695 RepID=UPI000DF7A85D|nr:GGDEF domain-containing phosphodiesterase [Exiguobacterium flavidum]
MTFIKATKQLGLSSDSPLTIGGLELSRPETAHAFFEGHPDAIFFFTLEGEIVHFNQNLPKIIGYPADALYQSFHTFTDPDELPEIERQFKRAVAGETVHYQARALHRLGYPLTLALTNMPIYQDGEIVGVYGIARDVTEDIQMKEHIEEIRFQLELTEQIPEIVLFHYDPETQSVERSSSLGTFLGIPPHLLSELSREQLLARIHPDDVVSFHREILRIVVGDISHYECEIRILNASSEYQLLLMKAARRKDPGSSARISVVLYDLTEVRKARHELESERQQAKEIYEALDAAISQLDLTTGEILFHSPGFKNIFETLPDDMLIGGDFLSERIDPRDLARVAAFAESLRDGKGGTITYRLRFPDGRIKWVEDKQIPVLDAEGTLLYTNSIMHDVTLREEYAQRLHHLAMHDPLTGIPNRTHATETLEKWIAEKRRFSVVTVAFNRITEINDAFGHDTGDEWIRQTSLLLERIRREDVFLAQLGGDEYVMFVPTKSTVDIRHCAELLVSLGEQPIPIDSYSLFARVSVGVSSHPENGSEPALLMKHAYTALRRSKREDKSSYHLYASNLDIDLYRRYQLEQDLHYAIEREQLFLEFQPKVDGFTGTIIGSEALIRWQHPEWGRIPPNDFIPLAEESALHLSIGDWVVDTACKTLASWQAAGVRTVPVSVNVSPKRFLQPDFDCFVSQTLKKHGLEPNQLELEITEATLVSEDPHVSQMLERLSALGVRIALDDFGKGYSSMAYLQRFPIDVVKIDRQFATHIATDRKANAIVKSILYMAREFDLMVVAEGIETYDQLAAFCRLNCPGIQGFLFSRPVAPNVFCQFLAREVLHPIEACSLAADQVPSFSIAARITLQSLNERPVEIGSSDIKIHQTSTTKLFFSTEALLPIEAGSFEVVVPTKQDDIRCSVRVTSKDGDLYEASYMSEYDADRLMRHFQRLPYE